MDMIRSIAKWSMNVTKGFVDANISLSLFITMFNADVSFKFMDMLHSIAKWDIDIRLSIAT